MIVDVDVCGCEIIKNGDRNIGKTEKQIHFSFKRLEELCNKDISEIIFVMSNKSNGFMDLFKQNKGPDWIFLLLKFVLQNSLKVK